MANYVGLVYHTRIADASTCNHESELDIDVKVLMVGMQSRFKTLTWLFGDSIIRSIWYNNPCNIWSVRMYRYAE